MGLAVSSQPEQSGTRTGDLDRAGRDDAGRAVCDHAGQVVLEGARGPGLLGHGRHGGARTATARPWRDSVSDLGPQRRRVAWAGVVGFVVQTFSETEVA